MLPALLHHRPALVVDALDVFPASFLHQPSRQTSDNTSSFLLVPPTPRSLPVQPQVWLALSSPSQRRSQRSRRP